MSTNIANAAFHAIANATSDDVWKTSKEPTGEELLAAAYERMEEYEYRREIAERRSDPWRWHHERAKYDRLIAITKEQIRILKGE